MLAVEPPFYIVDKEDFGLAPFGCLLVDEKDGGAIYAREDHSSNQCIVSSVFRSSYHFETRVDKFTSFRQLPTNQYLSLFRGSWRKEDKTVLYDSKLKVLAQTNKVANISDMQFLNENEVIFSIVNDTGTYGSLELYIAPKDNLKHIISGEYSDDDLEKYKLESLTTRHTSYFKDPLQFLYRIF